MTAEVAETLSLDCGFHNAATSPLSENWNLEIGSAKDRLGLACCGADWSIIWQGHCRACVAKQMKDDLGR